MCTDILFKVNSWRRSPGQQSKQGTLLSSALECCCCVMDWHGQGFWPRLWGSVLPHITQPCALSAFLQKLQGPGLLLLLPYFFTSWGPLHHRIIVFFVVWEVPQLWKKPEDRGVSLGVGILPGSRWWQQIHWWLWVKLSFCLQVQGGCGASRAQSFSPSLLVCTCKTALCFLGWGG